MDVLETGQNYVLNSGLRATGAVLQWRKVCALAPLQGRVRAQMLHYDTASCLLVTSRRTESRAGRPSTAQAGYLSRRTAGICCVRLLCTDRVSPKLFLWSSPGPPVPPKAGGGSGPASLKVSPPRLLACRAERGLVMQTSRSPACPRLPRARPMPLSRRSKPRLTERPAVPLQLSVDRMHRAWPAVLPRLQPGAQL